MFFIVSIFPFIPRVTSAWSSIDVESFSKLSIVVSSINSAFLSVFGFEVYNPSSSITKTTFSGLNCFDNNSISRSPEHTEKPSFLSITTKVYDHLVSLLHVVVLIQQQYYSAEVTLGPMNLIVEHLYES